MVIKERIKCTFYCTYLEFKPNFKVYNVYSKLLSVGVKNRII